MQLQVTDKLQSETNELRKTTMTGRHFDLGLALLSVLTALFAIFGLASWAELSGAHHAVQHVVLFVGGVGVGSSLTRILKGVK